MNTAPPNERLHALDAVRGFALLLGVHMSKLMPIPEEWVRRAWLAAMILFIVSMIWGFIPTHGVPKTTSNRAFSGAFAGIGYSYLVVLAVSLYLTYKQQNSIFMLIYTVVVFAGQGAGWYVAWILRRQAGYGVVAVGWYAAALTIGLNLLNRENFVLAVAISMLVLMALPGFVMMQKSRTTAAASS